MSEGPLLYAVTELSKKEQGYLAKPIRVALNLHRQQISVRYLQAQNFDYEKPHLFNVQTFCLEGAAN